MKDKVKIFLLLFSPEEKKDISFRVDTALPVKEETFRDKDLLPEFKELVGENIAFKKEHFLLPTAAKSNVSVLISRVRHGKRNIGACHSPSKQPLPNRLLTSTAPPFRKPLFKVNFSAMKKELLPVPKRKEAKVILTKPMKEQFC